ncbi:hypothetical protein B296_00012938 [Ensete ventricosum]|uniref:Uncharacterized protein n=1 Tax=Ensete ventricosum TaxID=4639 RepID=A0A426YSU8_ENSVE|nr:hypothetical protein B296_00012938 [Ensete ventricosum]
MVLGLRLSPMAASESWGDFDEGRGAVKGEGHRGRKRGRNRCRIPTRFHSDAMRSRLNGSGVGVQRVGWGGVGRREEEELLTTHEAGADRSEMSHRVYIAVVKCADNFTKPVMQMVPPPMKDELLN